MTPMLPIAALIVTEGKDVFNYNKILVAADALSVRDYTITMGDATGLPDDTEVRLGTTMKVGDYNGSLLKSWNAEWSDRATLHRCARNN